MQACQGEYVSLLDRGARSIRTNNANRSILLSSEGADLPKARIMTHEGLDDLMFLVAKGDEEAFAVVYDKVAGRVYGLIKRVLRDDSMSQEVAQEVLLEVWRNAPRFDATRGTALGWIMMMAHRRSIDRVRSEQASRDRAERSISEQSEPSNLDPVAEMVEDRLDRKRVQTALTALTPLQRRTIELAYYGGRSYREVAEMLDTPEGTIKSRIRDGLTKLAEVLRDKA